MAVRAKRKQFQKGDTVRLIDGEQTAKVALVGPFRERKGVVLDAELNGSRYHPPSALEHAPSESMPAAKAA